MRAFVLCLSAVIALTLGATPLSAQTLTVIRLATNPIDSGAEVFYAKELGLFAKAGFDVQIQPGQNGSAIAAAVASNAVDIGYADLGSLAKAHSRGIPFIAIAPAAMSVESAPVNLLIVRKDSPIRTARDFTGKVIAVPGLGTNSEYAVHAWIDRNGGDAASAKYVEMAYSAMPAALEAGRIDAAHVAEPFIATAKQTGRVLASAEDALGKDFLRTVWFANAAWAKEHPDVAARFAAVIHETALWANDKRNHARSAEILVKYTKIDPALVATMTRVRYGESLNPVTMQPEIDVNAKYGNFTLFSAEELLAKR
jgi:NitT/TauT family transport system substrate-binding protein